MLAPKSCLKSPRPLSSRCDDARIAARRGAVEERQKHLLDSQPRLASKGMLMRNFPCKSLSALFLATLAASCSNLDERGNEAVGAAVGAAAGGGIGRGGGGGPGGGGGAGGRAAGGAAVGAGPGQPRGAPGRDIVIVKSPR